MRDAAVTLTSHERAVLSTRGGEAEFVWDPAFDPKLIG